MNFAINDLALRYPSSSSYEAIIRVRQLINLIKTLKQQGLLNKLITDKKIRGVELAPNYYLEQILNSEHLTKEEKLYLKTFLVNATLININDDIVFIVNAMSSPLLAHSYINNTFVLSIESCDLFSDPYILGKLNITSAIPEIQLPNISKEEHINVHETALGKRVYENNPKHKVNYGWGSPMDLDDITAQQVLLSAIPVPNNNNHLINHFNGKYYSFRKHHNNCFHGYLDDTIPENLRTLLHNHLK